MAFSPTDPVLAHSLWRQLSYSRGRESRRATWRNDWAPLWVPLLLLMLPPDSFEDVEQPGQNEALLQEPPVLGGLAGP
jgi:hypothetical protein